MNSFVTQAYDWLPANLQNVAISLYGMKLYWREYGRKFEKILKEFENLQWLSHAELRVYQDERLASLINHCYHHVPYYRRIMDDRRLKPADIRTAGDLTKLPTLSRVNVRDNIAQLTSSTIKSSQLIVGHTSGTTGSPLTFYYDAQTCTVKNVVDWRQKSCANLHIGEPWAYLLGRVVVPVSRSRPPFWRKNWVLNHMFFSSFHMSPENLEAYVRQLHKFRPVAVEGYPSTMFVMARHLLSQNQTYPAKAVFTSSETLHHQQREAIEKAFECQLYDYYGVAERVAFATECEQHEGKHVNMDFGIVEVLDKNEQPVEAGQLGRIVSTGLHNFAMPLIRYKSDDVTAMNPQPCSCGRGFPLMANVTTKAEDIITTPDGRYISSSILTHPFKPLQGVSESQIIQEDLSHITVKIVKTPRYQDKDTEQLISELGRRVGDEMVVTVEFVDSIPRTKAGKFRWVISKVPLEF